MKKKAFIFILAFTLMLGFFASRSMAATYSLSNLAGTWYITGNLATLDDDNGDTYVGLYSLMYLPIKVSAAGAISSGGTGYGYNDGDTTADVSLKATGGTLKISTTTGIVSGTIKIYYSGDGETGTVAAYIRYGVMNTTKNIVSGFMMIPSSLESGTFTATKR